MPTLPLLQNFKWAFVRMDPKNVPAEFEVPEIIGVLKNIGQSLDMPIAHAPFSPKFLMAFVRTDPVPERYRRTDR